MTSGADYDTLDLAPRDFAACGDLAAAAIEAMASALRRARSSLADARIPIAGAAVARAADGTLRRITVGHNGRIPPPGCDKRATDGGDPLARPARACEPHDPSGIGYPSDHGETAAIRAAGDITEIDWRNAVFATTLSPCRMCARTIQFLYGRGLRHLVIGQSSKFQASADILGEMSDLVIVALENRVSIDAMNEFARRYPREWDADIGETPAGAHALDALRQDLAAQDRLVADVRAGRRGTVAAVVSTDHEASHAIHAVALDERERFGGNPCYAAPMLAVGRAGSAVNLRRAALVVSSESGDVMDRAAFGDASLGLCEQFLPGLIIARPTLSPDVVSILHRAYATRGQEPPC